MQKNDERPQSSASNDLKMEIVPPRDLREGDECPRCHEAKMEYDGLLVLRCPKCNFAGQGGVFTC
jgi:ribosomal protein L37AE/L43A